MLALFKKEIRSYFHSMAGYVFVALFLFMIGLVTSLSCLYGLRARYENVFQNCAFIFLIAVPVLTMRSFAEERRQKTDQLLYSLPVSTVQIVVGKYLAMLCVFAMPVLLSCAYPLLLRLFDPAHNLSYAAIYSTIGVFFCLGAALIAIGMFMSTLTENVFVSAIICFVTLLVCYLMSTVLANILPSDPVSTAIVLAVMVALIALLVYFMTKSRAAGFAAFLILELPVSIISFVKPALLQGLLPKVFGVLSMFERFYDLSNGLFNWTVIVYYLSVAVLFTVFTVQSLEKRRWS